MTNERAGGWFTICLWQWTVKLLYLTFTLQYKNNSCQYLLCLTLCILLKLIFVLNTFTFMHLATYSAFRLYIFFISMCVPWELNPWPFALLTQCSTTEPQEHCGIGNMSLKCVLFYYFNFNFSSICIELYICISDIFSCKAPNDEIHKQFIIKVPTILAVLQYRVYRS